MILVYTDRNTPRVSYAFNVAFRDVLGIGHDLTDDIARAESHDGPVIRYSATGSGKGLLFRPAGLLQEEGISEQEVNPVDWKGLPVFYGIEGKAEWPFDPFSVIFYLVARYEEYLPHEKDEHGRFMPGESLAHRGGFLQTPLVNRICFELAGLINQRYPAERISKPPLKFSPTFDVDIAFAHLAKGFPRNILGMARLLAKGKISELIERMAVVRGRKDDPYDNFGYQEEQLAGTGLKPLYFILMGDFGPYDRNNDYRSHRFREFLKRLSGKFEVGIHPSYKSFDKKGRLGEEILRLSTITGKPVIRSRQHFLRLRFPETYRQLIAHGITNDHSMGYSNAIGFRASIASVYYFYDLEREAETNLRIHPFFFMDSAFADRLGTGPGEALKQVARIKRALEDTGGEIQGIWHNYALTGAGPYEGWRDFFEKTVALFTGKNHDQVP